MPPRHVSFAAILSCFHLCIVLLGASHCWPTAVPCSRALNLYGEATSADTSYAFFANANSVTLVKIDARDTSGRCWAVDLCKGLTFEGRNHIVSLRERFRDVALRRELARRLGALALVREPRASDVTVTIKLCYYGSMSDRRRGLPQDVTLIYSGTIRRGDE